MKQGDGRELLTNVTFDLTGKPITIENGKKIIHGVDNNNLSLYIDTILDKKDINEVKDFYVNLTTSEYLEDYTNIISSIFRANINTKDTEKKLLKINKSN